MKDVSFLRHAASRASGCLNVQCLVHVTRVIRVMAAVIHVDPVILHVVLRVSLRNSSFLLMSQLFFGEFFFISSSLNMKEKFVDKLVFMYKINKHVFIDDQNVRSSVVFLPPVTCY